MDRNRVRRRHARDLALERDDAIRARLHHHLPEDPYDLWAREQLGLAYRRQGNHAEAGRWLALSPIVAPKETAAFRAKVPSAKQRWKLIGWPAPPNDQVPIETARRLREMQRSADVNKWGDPTTLHMPATSWTEGAGCVAGAGLFLLLATATVVGLMTLAGWLWSAVT